MLVFGFLGAWDRTLTGTRVNSTPNQQISSTTTPYNTTDQVHEQTKAHRSLFILFSSLLTNTHDHQLTHTTNKQATRPKRATSDTSKQTFSLIQHTQANEQSNDSLHSLTHDQLNEQTKQTMINQSLIIY